MTNNNSVQTNMQSRLFSVDYLKAFAVLLVIINHSLSQAQQLKIGGPFWINMAVPIFMIVSGYTYSMSLDRREIETFKGYFKKDLILSKILRIILPYLIVFLIEILVLSILPINWPTTAVNPLPIFLSFLTGGSGPGGYYLPILIQLLFLFPLMFFAFKDSQYKSIGLAFLVQFSFDILTNFLPISGGVYRLLIFRYLVFIIMGIALYHNTDELKDKTKLSSKKKCLLMFLSALSLIYIFIVNYTGYKLVIFTKWTKTSLPTIFLALGMVILGMKYLEIENKNKLTNIISKVGEASFHIFLAQKLYFGFIFKELSLNMNLSIVLNSIVSIILCCSIGVLFYYLDIRLKSFYLSLKYNCRKVVRN